MGKQERESSADASRPGVTVFDVLLRKGLRESSFPDFYWCFPHSSRPVSPIWKGKASIGQKPPDRVKPKGNLGFFRFFYRLHFASLAGPFIWRAAAFPSWHGRPARAESVVDEFFVKSHLFLTHRVPSFFRPGGPTSKWRWREPTVWIGGSFFSSSPGAWRPRQPQCRPSGAGVLGKQRVVYATHIVARASCPCGGKMSRDFV